MAEPKLEETFACMPVTERGRAVLLGGDPKTGTIAYANGKSIILRSLEDPLKCTVYNEHQYKTTVARFHPNGEWIASGDVSGIVRIWAAWNPDNTLKLEARPLAGSVDDLDWTSDGQRIVCSGDGKGSVFVRAFMWDSGSPLGEFDGHSKRVLSCSFRGSRPLKVATCGEDFGVNFYEGPPFRFKCSNKDHSNFVNCVRFSPDGTKFATVSSDKNVLLFNGLTGERTGQLAEAAVDAHTGSIYGLAWSPDSKQVLTVSADKSAKIWEVAADGSGGQLKTTFSFNANQGSGAMLVGCLWLGTHLLTVSLDGDISYLDPANPTRPSRILSGHSKLVSALAVAPPGSNGGAHGTSEIYSASYDGVLIHWRTGAGCLNRLETAHSNAVVSMCIPAGGSELVSCGLDDTVRWSALPEGKESSQVVLPGQPHSLDMTQDGDVGIVATANGVVLLHGKKVASTTPVPYAATAAALAPSGKEAAVGAQDGRIHLYAIRGDTLEEAGVLERHRGAILALRYSPNGAWLASGDQNREATVWATATHEMKLKSMTFHTARLTCLAWSPDSQHVVTGSLDTNLMVYDVDKPVFSRKTIKGAHPGGVTAVAWLDDSRIASAGDDACLRVWSVQSA